MNYNELFKGVDLKDYAPIPFWSWNNRLDIPELKRQIRNMKDVGMGGFIMHARMGLTTPYLGEEWFDCVEACLDEAKKLGMNGWVYDENGWPSGFVGGKLLNKKENLATYLELEKGEYNAEAYASFLCEKGHFRRVKASEGAGKYYNVILKYSPSNTDILKPSVVTEFIEETYEKYYERFGDRFGKEFTGFFTDEPQYFRWGTPFTVMLEEYFREHYGEDVRDGLIHIFFAREEGYAYRVKYYSAMNELYTVNYYKRIYDWCEGHGCKLTGHSIEESYHYMQMWGCAGCMPSYEYESIPGIDNLGKSAPAVLSARQVGSVAAQLGKKQVLTESFGCSGYDADPRLLRHIAEKQYVHGVNLMCHHLYSYSLAGQGKTDHPPCFSKHMTWEEDFGSFNEYLTRIGYMIAEGKDLVNTAVLSPMTSVYLDYLMRDETVAAEIDKQFSALQNKLTESNIEYHLLDEKLLSKYGRVEGKKLIVGNAAYDHLVLPKTKNIYDTTEKLLSEYVRAGGKIYVYEDAPEYVNGERKNLSYLRSNVSLSDIKRGGNAILDGDGVEYTHRNVRGLDYIYMVNIKEVPVSLSFDKAYSRVDVLSGEATETFGKITIPAHGSALLVKSEHGKAPIQTTAERDITEDFRFVKATDNNLTLDFVKISFDGKEYSEPQYVYDVLYGLIRKDYGGKLYVKYCFNVRDIRRVKLLKEQDKGEGFALNGVPVNFLPSNFDIKFSECDITPYLKNGENEFSYSIDFYQAPIVRFALFDPNATESLRNCLVFDTEIEPVYLQGDFSVEGRSISAPVKSVPINAPIEGGYKFFAGEMTYSANVTARAGKAFLRIEGDYMAASFTVNGKEYRATLTGEAEADLKEGVNEITFKFTASLRNMIGPFHCDQPETGISPAHFRMESEYDGKANEHFVQGYVLKPFGIRKITLMQ